jgi:hypothetical protein
LKSLVGVLKRESAKVGPDIGLAGARGLRSDADPVVYPLMGARVARG